MIEFIFEMNSKLFFKNIVNLNLEIVNELIFEIVQFKTKNKNQTRKIGKHILLIFPFPITFNLVSNVTSLTKKNKFSFRIKLITF